MKNPKHILITGASSGIGAALARHYAASGVSLYLTGRNETRLTDIAQACAEQGAYICRKIVDVTQQNALEKWILETDIDTPLDLVIANAGISGGTGGAADLAEPAEQVRAVFKTNLDGVMNTIDPVLPRMCDRGRGQIALMSSLASFSGWSGAPAYSASKAAVRTYGEALRGALRGTGVRVNVICPGFIKTPLTDVNEFYMPFMMRDDKAARIIAKGLAQNKGRIAFPWPTYLFAGVLGLLPLSWNLVLTSRAPKKPPKDSSSPP